MSKINLVFFNLPQKLPLVAELCRLYQRKPDFETVLSSDLAQTSQLLIQDKNGIVVFKVENKADLENGVNLLKSQKKLIKKGLVKTACLLFVKSKKVEKILQKYGCQEILDPQNVTSKTFGFKISFWSKNITAQLTKEEKDLAFAQKAKGGPQEKAAAQENKKDFVSLPPLELQSDMWISKHKNDHKRILRRYLCRMLGPSPHVGQWLELEARPGDSLVTWKFELREDNGQFVMEDGAWYFVGAKPDFDWKINRWNFSSDRPHLYFYTERGEVFSRIKFQEGQIAISENSTYALTKEEAILETCDKKYAFEKDKAGDEEERSLENEAQDEALGKKLEGKQSGESLETNWDGKGSSDNLGEGKIRGKLAHEGKEVENESDRSSFREEDQGGHYGGKGKTDHLDESPLSSQLKPGKVKEENKSHSSEFSEDDQGGHYGGKGKTDHLDEPPLSGQLKPNKSNLKREGHESEFFEGDQGGHYSGKGKTDHLDESPLSGQLKPNAPNLKKERNESEFSEDDLGGHYGGEIKTDEINDDPLSGQLNPNKPKLKEGDNHSDFSEDDLGGHYDGENKTDEINRDPLSGQLKPNRLQHNEESNDSEFSEEAMGGHYKGDAKKEQANTAPLKGKFKGEGVKDTGGSSRTEYGKDDLGGPLIGKAKTGMVDRSPLKGKNGASLEAKGEDEDSELDRDHLDKFGKKKKQALAKADRDGEREEGELEDPELERDHLDRFGKKKKAAQKAVIHPNQPEKADKIKNDEPERDGKDLLGRASKKRASAKEIERDAERLLGKNGGPTAKNETDPPKAAEVKEVIVVEGVNEAPSADSGQRIIPKRPGKENDDRPKENLEGIVGKAPQVSVESGEIKVVVSVLDQNGSEVSYICDFEDFFTDELVVNTQKGCMKLETNIKASLTLQYGNKNVSVKAKGVIAEIEEFSEQKDSFIIALEEIEESVYDNFMKLYQDRQENIQEFMRLAKGCE